MAITKRTDGVSSDMQAIEVSREIDYYVKLLTYMLTCPGGSCEMILISSEINVLDSQTVWQFVQLHQRGFYRRITKTVWDEKITNLVIAWHRSIVINEFTLLFFKGSIRLDQENYTLQFQGNWPNEMFQKMNSPTTYRMSSE